MKDLELFSKHKQMKDGHLNTCKECQSISNKKDHVKNKERNIARVKKWNEENPERSRKNKRKHYEENEEKIKNRASIMWTI